MEFFDTVPLSTRCELGQLALRFGERARVNSIHRE